jgi:hypothetical protein
MTSIGKTLVGVGIVLALVGLVLWGAGKLVGRETGLLPGDIVYRRGNFTFCFPIATSILLSVLLTLLLWAVSALRR